MQIDHYRFTGKTCCIIPNVMIVLVSEKNSRKAKMLFVYILVWLFPLLNWSMEDLEHRLDGLILNQIIINQEQHANQADEDGNRKKLVCSRCTYPSIKWRSLLIDLDPIIEEIDFSCSSYHGENIKKIKELKNLRVLNLRSCTFSPDTWNDLFNSIPDSLLELNLKCCQISDQIRLSCLSSMTGKNDIGTRFKSLSNLKIIDLDDIELNYSESESLNDSLLYNSDDSSTTSESTEIEKLFPYSWRSIINHLPTTIEKICIGGDYKGESIDVMIKLPNLKELNMIDAIYIKPRGIECRLALQNHFKEIDKKHFKKDYLDAQNVIVAESDIEDRHIKEIPSNDVLQHDGDRAHNPANDLLDNVPNLGDEENRIDVLKLSARNEEEIDHDQKKLFLDKSLSLEQFLEKLADLNADIIEKIKVLGDSSLLQVVDFEVEKLKEFRALTHMDLSGSRLYSDQWGDLIRNMAPNIKILDLSDTNYRGEKYHCLIRNNRIEEITLNKDELSLRQRDNIKGFLYHCKVVFK